MEMNNKYQVNATEENYTIHEPFEKGAREAVNPFNEAAIKGKIRFVRSVLRKTNISDPLIDQQQSDGTVHPTFIDHATADAAGHVYSDMSLMYIGADQKLFEQFIQNFEMCFEAINLVDAGKFLQHLYLQNKRLPDIIFIDLPLNEKDLKKFCGRLRYNLILNNLPVVYHENQLSKDELSTLQQLQLVDDIVVIDFEHINYHSKIMFLKQNKLHNQILAAKNYSPKNYLPQRKKQVITFPFFLKRVTDVLVSSTGLLILSPVFAIIATLIKLESRGPIFYTALRAGKGFKVFKFYKFRSMIANADKEVDNLSHKNQYTNIDGPKFF